MKKIFIIMCMALMSVSTFAQKGSVWAGVEGRYNLTPDFDYSNFGVGAKMQWECLDHIRLEPAVGYFFKKDNYEALMAEINAHVLIKLNKNNFNIYPIVGGALIHAYKAESFRTKTMEDGTQKTEDYDFKWKDYIQVQVGAGLDYPINDRLKLNAECKYVYFADYPTISVGLCVKL